VIRGVGLDLVEIDRVAESLKRHGQAFAERILHPDEDAERVRTAEGATHLAGLFAAKEAVMKALGVGLWKFAFRDVEVVRARSGAPSLALRGRAEELAGARGVRAWQLSLSHTDATAIAVAIAVG
jgi:holo-[acyl-carrier protein] synthase